MGTVNLCHVLLRRMGAFNRLNQQRGFTLLELLVVLVIIGIMLGAVSFSTMQSSRQRLLTDVQRIAVAVLVPFMTLSQ